MYDSMVPVSDLHRRAGSSLCSHHRFSGLSDLFVLTPSILWLVCAHTIDSLGSLTAHTIDFLAPLIVLTLSILWLL